MFEFWNEMLVSNIGCKSLLKSLDFRKKKLLEFWEERGEELMTCHLFLDDFSWNFMTFGLFSKVKSFETGFSFERTQISRLWYHEMFVFSEFFFFRKRHVLQEIDCVFVLAIRGLLHMIKNFVLWCDWCVLITITESFEKFP